MDTALINYTRTNAPVETVGYGQTVIPQNRLNYLYEACKEALIKRPGNVIEVGVYKGGTLLALAKAVKEICPTYKVYGIDTFSGHPYTDGHPVHYTGKYADVDRRILQNYIDYETGLGEFIELHTGRIENIWPSLNIGDISFAHIDCDLYIPIKYCCENILPVLQTPGVAYFDDYAHEHCPGATRAVDEVLNGIQKTIVTMDDHTSWSCFLNL